MQFMSCHASHDAAHPRCHLALNHDKGHDGLMAVTVQSETHEPSQTQKLFVGVLGPYLCAFVMSI
jgi:hypothetical protein